MAALVARVLSSPQDEEPRLYVLVSVPEGGDPAEVGEPVSDTTHSRDRVPPLLSAPAGVRPGVGAGPRRHEGHGRGVPVGFNDVAQFSNRPDR